METLTAIEFPTEHFPHVTNYDEQNYYGSRYECWISKIVWCNYYLQLKHVVVLSVYNYKPMIILYTKLDNIYKDTQCNY